MKRSSAGAALAAIVLAAGCNDGGMEPVSRRAGDDAGRGYDAEVARADAGPGVTGGDADVSLGEDAGRPPTLDAGAAPPVTGGGQLTVLDVRVTHTADSMAFTFLPVPDGVPSNLASPVDYAHGEIHTRVEVLGKPSDRGVSYQMCFFQTEHTSGHHACTAYLHFTAPGVYEATEPLTDIYQYGVVDWSSALLDLMLVVKDVDGNPVDTRFGFDGAWAGGPDLGLYYPMEVRFTAVIVPAGGTFAGWP